MSCEFRNWWKVYGCRQRYLNPETNNYEFDNTDLNIDKEINLLLLLSEFEKTQCVDLFYQNLVLV